MRRLFLEDTVMAKKSSSTIVMTPNEVKVINMDFSNDLGDADRTGTPTVTVSEDGPGFSNAQTLGKLAQAKFDASGVSPGLYTVTMSCNDDSAQTFEGIGELIVENVST